MEKNIFYMTFEVGAPWDRFVYEFDTYEEAVNFCNEMDLDLSNIFVRLYVKKHRFSNRLYLLREKR